MVNLPPHNPYAHLDHSYQYPLNAHHPHPSTAPQTLSHPPFATTTTTTSSSSASFSTSSFSLPSTQMTPQGTAENPLIPKRRRRTTPAELAILDSEYRSNPRPDPLERARIAERLGMTARAVQVWYQNRRQKDKKESSSFGGSSSTASSVASSGSDPRDLDGVVLSFSSSPLPSPSLPLFPTVGGGSSGAAAADPFKALAAPSSELYSSRSAANKENNAALPPPSRPAPTPLQTASAPPSSTSNLNYQYHYSYPSSASSQPAPAPPPHSSASHAHAYSTSSVPSVYLHRPHNASIIAAKKHVRKRPLGSHAPLARTPSLPHAFDFPPSPEKPPVASARKASLNDVVTRQQTATTAGVELRRSVSATAGVGLGIFSSAAAAGIRGETVASRRRSSTPLSLGGSVFGGGNEEEGKVVSPVEQEEKPAPAPVSLAAMTPTSKAKAKDDLLRHMQSDPPTASSPVQQQQQPLTRRRMAAHDAAFAAYDDEEDDDEEEEEVLRLKGAMMPRPLMPARSFSSSSAPAASFPFSSSSSAGACAPGLARSFSTSTSTAAFPSHHHHQHQARSLSLSLSFSSSVPASSSGPSLDKTIAAASSSSHSRAPGTGRSGEMACAVEALGRKRSRILETAPVMGRTIRSGNGTGLRLDLGAKRGRTVSQPPQQAAKRRRSSGVTAASSAATTIADEEMDEDDLADLSFSSTSTASTVDSLATVADSPSTATGYFALGAAVQAVQQDKNAVGGTTKAVNATDDREAAELLLSMGGFF